MISRSKLVFAPRELVFTRRKLVFSRLEDVFARPQLVFAPPNLVLPTNFGKTSAYELVFAALWLLVVHLAVVGLEGPDLRRKIGGSYEEYRRAVPRWLPLARRKNADIA